MAQLSVGRATLVIVHRLSTLRESDKILVMDKGRVIEAGDDPQRMSVETAVPR